MNKNLHMNQNRELNGVSAIEGKQFFSFGGSAITLILDTLNIHGMYFTDLDEHSLILGVYIYRNGAVLSIGIILRRLGNVIR